MAIVSLYTTQIIIIAFVVTIIAPGVGSLPGFIQEMLYPKLRSKEGSPHILFIAAYVYGLPLSAIIGIFCSIGSYISGISSPEIAYFIGPALLIITGFMLAVINHIGYIIRY